MTLTFFRPQIYCAKKAIEILFERKHSGSIFQINGLLVSELCIE